MKKCPLCRRAYEDSQTFCLEDGTPLTNESATAETLVLPRRKNRLPVVFVGVLLLGGALIGGWLLLASKNQSANRNAKQIAVSAQTPVPPPILTPTAALTPLPIVTPTLAPPAVPETNINAPTNSETKSADSETEIAAPVKTPEENIWAKPPVMKAEDHQVVFAVQQCRKSGSAIICDFSLTNKGQDRRFRLSPYESKLFDELGNGYRGAEAQVANQRGSAPEIGFVAGVTARARITFENLDASAARITLLNIVFSVGDDYGRREISQRAAHRFKITAFRVPSDGGFRLNKRHAEA